MTRPPLPDARGDYVFDLAGVRAANLRTGAGVCAAVGALALIYAVGGFGLGVAGRIVLAPLALALLGVAYALGRHAVPQGRRLTRQLTIGAPGIAWQGRGTSWRIGWDELIAVGVTRQRYEVLSGGSSDGAQRWLPRTAVVLDLVAPADLAASRPALRPLADDARPPGPISYRVGLGDEIGWFAPTADEALRRYAPAGRYTGIVDESVPRRTPPVPAVFRFDGGARPIG